MAMKLVLVGGVKGVGKTSILSGIENDCGGRITILDAGELFRQYHYRRKIKTTEEVERLIVEKICSAPIDSTVIAHWHYAVSRLGTYLPQVSFSRLEQIARCSTIGRVTLFLIEAPLGAVRERRMREIHEKKRTLDLQSIKTEIAVEEEFLMKHVLLFSRVLRGDTVSVVYLPNIVLEDTRTAFRAYVKKLAEL